MSLSKIRRIVDKIFDDIQSKYWSEYYDWLEELSEKQSAKYWITCYYFAYKDKLLPLIPELERDTEENFDIGYWNGPGRELFENADEANHKKFDRCAFCQINVDAKSLLEKEFEQEQQQKMEETRNSFLKRPVTTYPKEV